MLLYKTPFCIFNKLFSRICLIRISQPSIFSFSMPFSFFLSSFPLLFGLKKMTRFISLSMRCTLLSVKWQCFYREAVVLSQWFQEASSLFCFLCLKYDNLNRTRGHRCCSVCQPQNGGPAWAWGEESIRMRMDECKGELDNTDHLWNRGQLLLIDCGPQVI